MGFQKGHKDFVPPESRRMAGLKISQARKGKKFSESHCLSMSRARKGRPTWWMARGLPNPMTGRKTSENLNHKKAMEAFRGENNPMYGKKLTVEQRGKISESLRGKMGELSRRWKGGVSPINQRLRSSEAYKAWRWAVFIRDRFTCQECGCVGGTLNADHIKSFAYYPELRFDVSNGRTLCLPCHKLTPNYCGRNSNFSRNSLGQFTKTYAI